MRNDPIVAEVRKVRESILRQCNYDLKKLGKYLQARRKETGLKTVRRAVRRKRA